MNRLTKLIIALACLLGVLALRPVPHPREDNMITRTAQAKSIFAGGGEADIVFLLENDEGFYYINRGLESGLDLQELKSVALGQQTTLRYIKHWTPLDPFNRTRHVAEVLVAGEVLYSEFH